MTRRHTKRRNNEADGIRTRNLRIDSPVGDSVTCRESGTYDGDAETPTSNPTTWNENPTTCPELNGLIDAWPTLPDAVRAGIVAMVNAATGGAR